MSKSTLGILLIALGIIALAYQGFSYTRREKAVDLGPLQVSVDRERTVPIPPIVGGIAIAAGVALLLLNKKD